LRQAYDYWQDQPGYELHPEELGLARAPTSTGIRLELKNARAFTPPEIGYELKSHFLWVNNVPCYEALESSQQETPVLRSSKAYTVAPRD